MTGFTESFARIIDMVDPMANSLMSKDNPPSLKILADWSRKAVRELEDLQAELATLKTNNDNLAILALQGGAGHDAIVKKAMQLQAENDKFKPVIEQIVEYFRSDKAMFPKGTLDDILNCAENALKGGE